MRMDEKRSQVVEYPKSEVKKSSGPMASADGSVQGRVSMAQSSPGPSTAPIRGGTATQKTGIAVEKGTKTKGSGLKFQGMKTPIFRKQRALIASALVFVIALGVLGVLLYNHFVVLNVTAFQVGPRQNVSQEIGGGGLVYASQQFNLSFPIAVHVNEVLVSVGDHVKANQPLLKLDQTSLNAQVKMFQDNVSAAEAYLYSVSNAFPYNPVAVAKAQHDLQEARNKYQAMKAQASSGNAVSPIDGLVSDLNVAPGESYGGKIKLVTVIDPSSLIVHAKVPLANFGRVHAGMKAQVTPPVLSSRSLAGKVISVVPQADAQTDTFEVWVQVDNKEQVLLPGMSAFVNIAGQTQAFVLPRLAVLDADHQARVFQIQDGHAVIKDVHVIGRDENSIYVDSGVVPGETIVLLPLGKLHDGQGVHVTRVQHA